MRRWLAVLLAAGMVLAAGCGKTNNQTEKNAQTEVETEEKSYADMTEDELEVLANELDVEAQMQLANRLDYGTDEVVQDLSEARKWYEMAAESGNADALCVLGYYALNGIEQDVDLEEAVDYFTQAENAGCTRALVGLGRAYLLGYSGEDAEANRASLAYAAIEQAYRANEPSGLYYMGVLLEEGIGTDVNIPGAMELYTKVTELTNLSIYDAYLVDAAQTSLGLCYVHGRGVAQDYAQALSAFTKAAENGYAKAEYYLGQMYESGFGTEQDYGVAFSWYEKAAEQNYAPALNQIGYLYYNGYGVDTDIDQAVYYQKLAAMQGYAAAQINLGYLFENGIGVEQNLATALSYYQMAVDQGQDGAKEAVARVRMMIDEEE